jgi:hypothetical protein
MANTDNSNTAVIQQDTRRVLAGYPFTIDCGVIGENNINPEGGEIIVTWYKDGSSLSTGLSYTVEKPTSDDSGTYYFVATNEFGSTTSQNVDIEIVTPGEDQFGINLVQNAMGENGLSSWSSQIGTLRLEKFWAKSGDRSWLGAGSRFPAGGRIDPMYRQRDGLAFFTAEDYAYRMMSGRGDNKQITIIEPNPGGVLTTAYQDVFITEPDTIDIIDRKIEGVFDVEAKCFAWLAQCRSTKVWFKDGHYSGGFRSENDYKLNGDDNDYVETKRDVHDESKIRYEFYDINDELVKDFEMDSFRPTQRSNAAVIGYRSISIPPGTRRVRVHMMFRRAQREWEWTSRRTGTFAKQYLCGIHAVNLRLFINKDGLKFPSTKFNPDDIIDSSYDDWLEDQIYKAEKERRRCNDLIEDVGNIEIKNKITSTYKHPSQTGVRYKGLVHLAQWCRHELHRARILSTYAPRPFPGKDGSVYSNIGRVTNVSAGSKRPNSGHINNMNGTSMLFDYLHKMNAPSMSIIRKSVHIIGKGIPYFRPNEAANAMNFLSQINYFYHRDDIISMIETTWKEKNPGVLPWWEIRWKQIVEKYHADQDSYAGGGELRWYSQTKALVSCIMGETYDGSCWTHQMPTRVLIAFALATYDTGTMASDSFTVPGVFKSLFYRPGKGLHSFFSYPNNYNAYGFNNYTCHWHNYWLTWDNVFKTKTDDGPNWCVYNKGSYAHVHWISRSYLAEFMSKLDDFGESRIYDKTIQMSVREIWDSVYDPDFSHKIYKDSVRMYTPPCSLGVKRWVKPNPDDEDTWSTMDPDPNEETHLIDRLEDISESKQGNFTYSMINQGNYKIGYHYPCEIMDNNPVSLYTGGNSAIYRPIDDGVAKIVWPLRSGTKWYKHRDIMYDMNRYTVMDFTLDEMVEKIDEIPGLKNFFECTRKPIIFHEDISMRSAPFEGEVTGNFGYNEADRQNTWHGYYSHYKQMQDTLELDTEGHARNGDTFAELGSSHFENHKGLSVPEFYKGSVLSGATDGMPQDAPFRYQGANPTKCLTKYDNEDGLTSFSINKNNNLGNTSANSSARTDKLLRTYAMAFARRYLLTLRIKYLNEQLQEALDWVDTQGDEYGYDQTNTATQDD